MASTPHHTSWIRAGLSVLLLAICISFAGPDAGATPNQSWRSATVKRATRKPIPQCRDRRDNDRDGKIDYPRDSGCRSRNDRTERRDPKPTPTATRTPVPPDPGAATPTATPTVNPGTPGNGGEGVPDLGEGANLNGKRVFPIDNPWNVDISNEPVDPNSATLIASIGTTTGLHPDFGTVYEGAPIGIPYVVVPGSQAKVSVDFEYADESDAGPYPIPANPPIEGGPNSTGDRHILMIDRDNWKLYELFAASFSNGKWSAGSGAIFDLNSNELRPAGWTSADAAGLPIFPGLVRYDEVVVQKKVEHALRFTVQRSRRAYVYPARHFASSNTSSSLPPMGMRVRLKASYDISTFPANVQVILTAMKKYGMIVADNGSNWFVSGAPDSRWDDDELRALKRVKGQDFEVVKMGTVVTQ